MVLEANIDDLEKTFQQKLSNIKFDTTVTKYLKKIYTKQIQKREN